MNELYVRFYEVSNDFQLDDCWINDMGDPDEVQILLDEFDIDFYDDVLEPIQTQVGTQSISQIDLVYNFPFWFDICQRPTNRIYQRLVFVYKKDTSVLLNIIANVSKPIFVSMVSLYRL